MGLSVLYTANDPNTENIPHASIFNKSNNNKRHKRGLKRMEKSNEK